VQFNLGVNGKKEEKYRLSPSLLAVWLILIGKFSEFWEKTHYQKPGKKDIIYHEPKKKCFLILKLRKGAIQHEHQSWH
jgi:hypothetical protein